MPRATPPGQVDPQFLPKIPSPLDQPDPQDPGKRAIVTPLLRLGGTPQTVIHYGFQLLVTLSHQFTIELNQNTFGTVLGQPLPLGVCYTFETRIVVTAVTSP